MQLRLPKQRRLRKQWHGNVAHLARLSLAWPSRGVLVPGVTVLRQGCRAGKIGQEWAKSWWILAAGGDENPTCGGAGQSV